MRITVLMMVADNGSIVFGAWIPALRCLSSGRR